MLLLVVNAFKGFLSLEFGQADAGQIEVTADRNNIF